MKKRFTEEQIIGFLREVEAGVAVKDLCRRKGFSPASFYQWRAKFGGMSVSEAKRLKELEAENGRLKKLVAELVLESEVVREALKKVVRAPARRELVRWMSSKGLPERAALRVIAMSASALRYRPRQDRNGELRATKLWALCAERLSLSPDAHAEKVFKAILGQLPIDHEQPGIDSKQDWRCAWARSESCPR